MAVLEAVTESIGRIKESKQPVGESEGLNTFYGVFLPCMLSFFGVIFYLRMGWILGNVGLLQTSMIIVISSMITFVTGLSISATATNMQVKGGGAYYILSRSFGIEIGSAIGLALYFAQVIGIALYIEGFSESIRFLFPSINPFSLEMVALLFVTVLTFISANTALATQIFILFIIGASLLSFLFGGPIEWDGSGVEQTFAPVGFWAVFAVFFPAITGIEAGFSMAGSLKNSRRSLPIGILSSVLAGLVIYFLVVMILYGRASVETFQSDSMVFFHVSGVETIALLGVWGATLAGSIGCLIGAPRTLQALANDSVIPQFLGKGYGAANEPRIATILTFVISLICLYFGDIDLLAPILTMVFLISYGMLNLAAGLESLFGNPSWRPSFATPSLVSLLGSGLCLMAMLMIDAGQTIIAITIVTLFYLFIKRKKLGGGWEDIRQGALLFFCRFAIYRLSTLGPSARSWRPYFLVFSSSPTQKTSIIDFAHSLTKEKGFLTVASVVTTQAIEYEKIESLEEIIRASLKKRKVQCLIELEKADDCYSGMKKMMTTYGLGPITPNTIVFGSTLNEENYAKIAEVILLAHDLGRNVIILKDEGEELKGAIDIWWDENSKMNTELMLVLAHMLNGTSQWKKSSVNLKCIVQNEDGRQQREKYFEEFFSRSRMNVEVRVLVIPHEEEVTTKTISRFSSDAGLTFLGIRPPGDEESNEEYTGYIKELMHQAKHFKKVAYVLGSEKVELKKIFDYPES